MDRLAQLPKLLKAKYGERYPMACIVTHDDGTGIILTSISEYASSTSDSMWGMILFMFNSMDELYAHLTEEK